MKKKSDHVAVLATLEDWKHRKEPFCEKPWNAMLLGKAELFVCLWRNFQSNYVVLKYILIFIKKKFEY